MDCKEARGSVYDFSIDDIVLPPRHWGVIEDSVTGHYVRWCRKDSDGVLRLAVEDCYRFLRVKRTEKPSVSSLSACMGRHGVVTCKLPKDDDDDGQIVCRSAVPFAMVPTLLVPLPHSIRGRALPHLGTLVRVVAEWEAAQGLPSQRPWPKGTSQDADLSVP